jgi:hypothetical protein
LSRRFHFGPSRPRTGEHLQPHLLDEFPKVVDPELFYVVVERDVAGVPHDEFAFVGKSPRHEVGKGRS